MLGDIFVMLASVTGAIFVVGGKEVRDRYDGLRLTTIGYTASAAILSPVTLWKYVGVFRSVIAYLIAPPLVTGGALVLAGVFWTERQ